MEPWFHPWYRGTLDAKYNLVALLELLLWPHEVEPWFHSWYRGRVETLDAKYNLCGYINSSKGAIKMAPSLSDLISVPYLQMFCAALASRTLSSFTLAILNLGAAASTSNPRAVAG